ncbi:MAG: efflux RND transporter periplasmic adaptor subunit [Phycisphaerales bacterium]|nr:efflux RND transporter periplasmic adaptor subunit [Phycisphaerales bacterium]
MNRPMRTLWRWGGMIVLLGGIVFGVQWIVMRLARPVVTLTQAVDGPVVQAFYATGTISPQRDYPIKSNTAGIITELKVDKGSAVKAGDELARVSDPELQFKYDQAKATVTEKAAMADEKTSPALRELDAKIAAFGDLLAIAQREEKRITDLIERNAASTNDLDQAIDRLKRMWAETESLKAQRASKQLELQKDLEVAQAALRIAQWNLDQQVLRSPVDGVVLDRPTSLGTRVAVNDHLMLVADVSAQNLVMRAAVDEEDKNKVHPGQVVRMTLYSFPAESFEGTVDRIYDQADPKRRTFEIDVKLSKPDTRFSPGMTGELAFIMGEKTKATIVPAQAWQEGALWTVRDHQLKRVEAKIGLRSIERIEVLSGLSAGVDVVISPIGKMNEGQRVRIERIDPMVAAGLNKHEQNDGFKGFN